MSEQNISAPAAGALPISRYRRFESLREYEILLNAKVPQTESMILVFDRKLPPTWNDKERIGLLRQFLLKDRTNKLMIVLHVTDNIEREMPRLVEFVNYFGHMVKIRQTPKMARHVYDPFVIFDASHYLHRFHYAHMRAAEGCHDVEGAQQLLDRHAELWDVSVPVSLASVSGL